MSLPTLIKIKKIIDEHYEFDKEKKRKKQKQKYEFFIFSNAIPNERKTLKRKKITSKKKRKKKEKKRKNYQSSVLGQPSLWRWTFIRLPPLCNVYVLSSSSVLLGGGGGRKPQLPSSQNKRTHSHLPHDQQQSSKPEEV
jgi:hypothetical protein